MVVGFSLRAVTIIAVSLVISVVHVAYTGRPWAPTQEQLRKEREEQSRREHAKGLRAQLEEQAGLSLDDFRRFMEMGQAVFVDARERKQFEEGHLKVPTIINIPESEVKQLIGRLTPDVVAGREIVLYCNGLECPAAEVVYVELQQLFGYDRMFIYFEGWDGITRHQLPTTVGPESDLNPAYIGMWPEEIAAFEGGDAAVSEPGEPSSGDQP